MAAGEDAYVNPFSGKRDGNMMGWGLSRTDSGVDYLPPKGGAPVYAIGAGKVTYSSSNEKQTGWPGGAFLVYQLADGSCKGNYVYVAEHLTNLVPVGTNIQIGDTVANALEGSPWTEWGWAKAPGTSSAAFDNWNADGQPAGGAAGGKMFARFMNYLGVPTQTDPGSGPITPAGAAGPQWNGTAVTPGSGGTGGGGSNSSGGGSGTNNDKNGTVLYAENFAKKNPMTDDLPDPRDNLPFSPQFMGWAVPPGYDKINNFPGWGTGGYSAYGAYRFQDGSGGWASPVGSLIRGGMAEAFVGGVRPRGNFKVYFMLNPESIAIATDITTNNASPTAQETLSPGSQEAAYVMQAQTISFTLVFNRMYEVWMGNYKGAGGGVGPSDIGCLWDVRAVERLVGMFDVIDESKSIGQGLAGGSHNAPASRPVQVVFGGPKAIQFVGRIASLATTYTLFSREMVPIQASVDVSVIRQYQPTLTSYDLVSSLVQSTSALGVPVIPNQTGGYDRANVMGGGPGNLTPAGGFQKPGGKGTTRPF
jgi:hypothetical protein